MSLDVYLAEAGTEVFARSITHDLADMAQYATLYYAVWRPEEQGITKAKQLILTLKRGLRFLKSNPVQCRRWTPENGYGSYEGLVTFVQEYLEACQKHPDADVRVSR
jgi:hypothetical protein